MGRYNLPSISKLEDVLDLLTDPTKYIQAMQEFKVAYDEAKLALADLDTKQKADRYLSDALDAQDQAAKDKATAKALLTETYRVKDETAAQLAKDEKEMHARLDAAQHDFDSAVAEFKKEKQAYLEFRSDSDTYLAEQHAEITKSKADAEVLVQELATKRAKLEAALKG